jgi:hypothetical protein
MSLVLRLKMRIRSRAVASLCTFVPTVLLLTLLTKLCQHIFISCSNLLAVKEASHYDTFSADLSVFHFSNLEQISTRSFK